MNFCPIWPFAEYYWCLTAIFVTLFQALYWLQPVYHLRLRICAYVCPIFRRFYTATPPDPSWIIRHEVTEVTAFLPPLASVLVSPSIYAAFPFPSAHRSLVGHHWRREAPTCSAGSFGFRRRFSTTIDLHTLARIIVLYLLHRPVFNALTN